MFGYGYKKSIQLGLASYAECISPQVPRNQDNILIFEAL